MNEEELKDLENHIENVFEKLLGTSMVTNFVEKDGKILLKKDLEKEEKKREMEDILEEMEDVSDELEEIPKEIVRKWLKEIKALKE